MFETFQFYIILLLLWLDLLNFATNSKFLIPISLQPDGETLWYLQIWLFDITEFKVCKKQKSKLGCKDMRF